MNNQFTQLRGTQPNTDRQTVKRLAIFPTKVKNQWIWLKCYYVDEYYVYGYTRNSFPGIWNEFEDTRRFTPEIPAKQIKRLLKL